MAPRDRSPRTAPGFTLVEILVVVLIAGIVLAMAAALTRGVTAAQKRTITNTRLAGVDAALAQFVLQQRRLPCPADGTLPSAHNNAGTEGARNATGCTGTQQNGVVPWRALGLTENDATDGWERRLTYRIRPGDAADNALDASWCDPVGTATPATPAVCSNACVATSPATCTPPSHFLKGRGLKVRNLAGTLIMDNDPVLPAPHTGAAYVLISHGESGGGGYLNTGVLSTSNTTDGDEEIARNYANVAYNAAGHYVDNPIVETAGAGHFDDIVSRPTVLSVVTKAGLGPRSH